MKRFTLIGAVLVLLVTVQPLAAQGNQIFQDTLQILFDPGSDDGVDLDSLVSANPWLSRGARIANLNPSVVMVVDVACDSMWWKIARQLGDSQNSRKKLTNMFDGAEVIARELTGRTICSLAGLKDPLNNLAIVRHRIEYVGEGPKNVRFLKIYFSKKTFPESRTDTLVVYDSTTVVLASNDGGGIRFGGVHVGISTMPQADGALLLGASAHLSDRWSITGYIGYSGITNTKSVENGSTTDAVGKLFSGSLTYWPGGPHLDSTVVIDSLTSDTTYDVSTSYRFGIVCAVTQLQNDTKSSDQYLWRRRMVELGLEARTGIFALRGLVGYGWDNTWYRDTSEWGFTARAEIAAIIR